VSRATGRDEMTMDPQEAAALMAATRRQARSALAIRLPLVYLPWGAAWLIGLGAMWLSVRDQRPYQGPSGAAVAVLVILLLAAVGVTMIVVTRATRGVSGPSAVQGRIYGLSWPIGFAALFLIEGALGQHGASGAVLGIVSGAGPILVTGLIYVLAAAIWLDWSMFWLGAWLAVVAAAGAWAGPVGLLLIGALAGGGGFLAMAGFLALRHRP
jgi:hypothetical protein